MLDISNDMYDLLKKKVLFIARRYSNNCNMEDLIQAGMLGIVKAREKYDEKMKVKFSTFCELYIKGEILDFIRRDKNIRVSRDYIRLKKEIDIIRNRFYEENRYMPSLEELSQLTGESKEKILEVINFDQNIRSIDEPINDLENELSLKDIIYKKEDIDLVDLISLRDALNNLSHDKKKLIEDRYYFGKTQSEIAENLNISQVKVYRLEKKILDELGEKLAS